MRKIQNNIDFEPEITTVWSFPERGKWATHILKNGFILKEDIIKAQHNCQTTPKWRAMVENYDFYLIMHEHLFIFRKPKESEDLSIYRESNLI